MTESEPSQRPPAPRRTRPKDSGGWDTRQGAKSLGLVVYCVALVPLVIGAILCEQGLFILGVAVWVLTVVAAIWVLIKRWRRAGIRAEAEASRADRMRNRKP